MLSRRGVLRARLAPMLHTAAPLAPCSTRPLPLRPCSIRSLHLHHVPHGRPLAPCSIRPLPPAHRGRLRRSMPGFRARRLRSGGQLGTAGPRPKAPCMDLEFEQVPCSGRSRPRFEPPCFFLPQSGRNCTLLLLLRALPAASLKVERKKGTLLRVERHKKPAKYWFFEIMECLLEKLPQLR